MSVQSPVRLDNQVVKHTMFTDILHLVGIAPCDRKKLKDSQEVGKQRRLLFGNQGQLKRRNMVELHAACLNELPDEDLEVIMEAEDELRRRGHFERIYPCRNVAYYSQFFLSPRYNNVVLEKWVQEEDWSVLARFMTDRAIEERWAAVRQLQLRMAETLTAQSSLSARQAKAQGKAQGKEVKDKAQPVGGGGAADKDCDKDGRGARAASTVGGGATLISTAGFVQPRRSVSAGGSRVGGGGGMAAIASARSHAAQQLRQEQEVREMRERQEQQEKQEQQVLQQEQREQQLLRQCGSPAQSLKEHQQLHLQLQAQHQQAQAPQLQPSSPKQEGAVAMPPRRKSSGVKSIWASAEGAAGKAKGAKRSGGVRAQGGVRARSGSGACGGKKSSGLSGLRAAAAGAKGAAGAKKEKEKKAEKKAAAAASAFDERGGNDSEGDGDGEDDDDDDDEDEDEDEGEGEGEGEEVRGGAEGGGSRTGRGRAGSGGLPPRVTSPLQSRQNQVPSPLQRALRPPLGAPPLVDPGPGPIMHSQSGHSLAPLLAGSAAAAAASTAPPLLELPARPESARVPSSTPGSPVSARKAKGAKGPAAEKVWALSPAKAKAKGAALAVGAAGASLSLPARSARQGQGQGPASAAAAGGKHGVNV